jgi:hypothetical protein
MDFDELLSELDPTGEWSTDGYGLDCCLIHCTMVEQDAKCCPECGAPNPLRGIL